MAISAEWQTVRRRDEPVRLAIARLYVEADELVQVINSTDVRGRCARHVEGRDFAMVVDVTTAAAGADDGAEVIDTRHYTEWRRKVDRGDFASNIRERFFFAAAKALSARQ